MPHLYWNKRDQVTFSSQSKAMKGSGQWFKS